MKVAGNYAADILPNTLAKKSGFPIALYLGIYIFIYIFIHVYISIYVYIYIYKIY